jgi:hypothetical protein
MGTTTDQTLVDSGVGTYVWDYSQDPTSPEGSVIISGRDKNQVAGLELKETMILCG